MVLASCRDKKLQFRVTLTWLSVSSHQVVFCAASLCKLYLYNKERIKCSLKRERK